MIPIGILTRDRVDYLDVTLRSLSATDLPAGISVTVFDDGSSDLRTLEYISDTKALPSKVSWPNAPEWRDAGLDVVQQHYVVPHGIKDKVFVDGLSDKPQGVVNASCNAIRLMFLREPAAPAVILLQDDVIFKEDWFARLQFVAGRDYGTPLGVLAGMRLNRKIDKLPGGVGPSFVESGATAQCLYIARKFYEAVDWFRVSHKRRNKFDDDLCKATTKAGFLCGLIYPFVCQHIGTVSSVRPKVGWHRGGAAKTGRIGYYASPPYAMATEVRRF